MSDADYLAHPATRIQNNPPKLAESGFEAGARPFNSTAHGRSPLAASAKRGTTQAEGLRRASAVGATGFEPVTLAV